MSMRSTRFGSASLYPGLVAMALACAARQFALQAGMGRGFVLQWFERHGWVRPPAPLLDDMRAQRLLTLDDAVFVSWLDTGAVGLALGGLVLFLLTEVRGEESLLPSTGFICAATALFLVDPVGALSAIVAVSMLVTVRRRTRWL